MTSRHFTVGQPGSTRQSTCLSGACLGDSAGDHRRWFRRVHRPGLEECLAERQKGLNDVDSIPERYTSDMTQKRAGLYARLSISTEESVSIARQLAACRQYAAARGMEVVLEAVDDGVSAT